ncbi:dynein axonemal assembly factor 1-like [Neocloeon triangulifer]|uniref:dynein axonemal assembly factor 1-like n=1 Tax=Neocloeon triangulifer TaxID=2078957 RepID=UPI00286ED8F1|nr:dynein axonemal assembly factor 1-like [Neocloeon triangulifer]
MVTGIGVLVSSLRSLLIRGKMWIGDSRVCSSSWASLLGVLYNRHYEFVLHRVQNGFEICYCMTTFSASDLVTSLFCGRISKEYLYKLCAAGDEMYAVPHLNNVLYLHYQGIRKIENLDDYVNLKCLYLQNNYIIKIENLDCLQHLRLLFLNSNCIDKIENLEGLQQLDKIDLSKNNIKVAENLSCLKSLTSLDLSYNSLTHIDDIAHLSECMSLTLLRLSHNKLADPETVEVIF